MAVIFTDDEIAELIQTSKQLVDGRATVLGITVNSLAVFEDSETVDRKVFARCMDVCERRYLGRRNERMRTYIDRTNPRVTAGGRRDDR